MKLYRVNLQGFYNTKFASPMVVAKDPTTAYETVKFWLKEKDYGFEKDREMKSIELIADSYEHTKATSILFLQQQ
jgi:hypothetical protein